MRITGSSVETVDIYLNSDKEGCFEKIFSVRNTCCGGMNLILKFDTNLDDMTLRSMSLEEILSWKPVINSDF